MARTIEQFIEHGVLTGIVGTIARRGCSSEEINALEKKYSVSLPHSYRKYLEVMGHNSSRLFSHDHMLVDYRYILCATEKVPQVLALENPEIEISLPENALVIASRLGICHWFIRCCEVVDSPVWMIKEPDYKPVQTEESYVEWLFNWITEAAMAIKSGYYEQRDY